MILVYVFMYVGQQHAVNGSYLFPGLVIGVILAFPILRKHRSQAGKTCPDTILGQVCVKPLYTQHVFCPGLSFANATLHRNLQCMEKYKSVSLRLMWDIFLNIGLKTVFNMYSTLNYFISNTYTPAHSCSYLVSQSYGINAYNHADIGQKHQTSE